MTQRPPSKMNNAQLRVALAEAKQDTKNTGEHWRAFSDKKDKYIGKRDEIIKELTDKLASSEKDAKFAVDELSSDIKERDQSILAIGGRLIAADQQCQEYKSIAEHCGEGNITRLVIEKDKLHQEVAKLEIYRKNLTISRDTLSAKLVDSENRCKDMRDIFRENKDFDWKTMYEQAVNANAEWVSKAKKDREVIAGLQTKNKCLKDELSKWQNRDKGTIRNLEGTIRNLDRCQRISDGIVRVRTSRIKELETINGQLNSDLRDVQTISDSVDIDEYTQAPTDAHGEIRALQSVLDSANAQIDALETQIKNQSETILRMAGQMFGGGNGG